MGQSIERRQEGILGGGGVRGAWVVEGEDAVEEFGAIGGQAHNGGGGGPGFEIVAGGQKLVGVAADLEGGGGVGDRGGEQEQG